jgi:Mrp family chromosome partitioning ATPase
MSALDQAFIKAYKHKGPATRLAPTEAKPSGPGPNIDCDKIENHMASTACKLNDVMAALEKPSSKTIADTPTAESAGGLEDHHSGKNEGQVLAFPGPSTTRAAKSKPGPKRKKKAIPAPTLDELDVPEAIYRLDPPSPTIPDGPRGAAFMSAMPHDKSLPEGPSPLPAGGTADLASAPGPKQTESAASPPADLQKNRRFDYPQAETQGNQATGSPATGNYPESAIRVFQPMLQVDHFAWPKVCQRMESIAALELSRLAEKLEAAAKQGMKVVGLCSGQRGEGATTLLLCAARQLVARNVKIALVDADLAEPQLAKRLGLLPQLGWEDVAAGRQPVEEVLIESAGDRIVVLPLCGPLAIAEMSFASQRIMAESLETLRKNYDLVLLDLGPLEDPQSLGDLTSGGLNCRIDAVTVVHKAGKILATCQPAVRQSLAAAGVAVTGVIENFVPNQRTSEYDY